MNSEQKAAFSTIQAFYKAFNTKDANDTEPLLAEDFTLLDFQANLSDKQRLLANMVKDKWVNETYNIADPSIRLSPDGNQAVIHYNIKFSGHEGDGKIMNMSFAETVCLRKENDQWKMFHFHFSMVPFKTQQPS